MEARWHLQAEWAWNCLAVRALLSLGQITLMRQQVVLLPRPAPNSIIPTTPQRAPSSATMVVAMPVSDASRKVSLNHNLTGCDRHTAAHPAVTVRLMTYIGIPTYLQPVRSKKPRKAATGQKEMLSRSVISAGEVRALTRCLRSARRSRPRSAPGRSSAPWQRGGSLANALWSFRACNWRDREIARRVRPPAQRAGLPRPVHPNVAIAAWVGSYRRSVCHRTNRHHPPTRCPARSATDESKYRPHPRLCPLERVSNHLVWHCREIVVFRQARNPGKLPDTVHCNPVRPGSGSAAQVMRRQNPKRGLRRSCPDWEEQ